MCQNQSDEKRVNSLLKAVPELTDVMTVDRVIGEGTFSTVYLATLHPHLKRPGTSDKVAVKHISQLIKPSLQANELRCLVLLEGKCNIIELLFAIRHEDSLVLVMPHVEHERFARIVKRFSCEDTKAYMIKLLSAMRHLHSHNIIHRDVKPSNFLYNSRLKEGYLVDFGLAELDGVSCELLDDEKDDTVKQESANPLTDVTNSNSSAATSTPVDFKEPSSSLISGVNSKKKQCGCKGKNQVCRICMSLPMVTAARAGTAGFRPPEVLLKCSHQTTAVDIWAVGIILLSILSGRSNFFDSPDDLTNLTQLILLFGSTAMSDAASAMGKQLICDLGCPTSVLSLKDLCEKLQSACSFRKSTRVVYPDTAYDLLEKLLALNPEKRITAADALQHDFLCQ